MSRKDLNHAGNGRGAERIPPQCWRKGRVLREDILNVGEGRGVERRPPQCWRMEVALREDLLNAGGGWRRCSENRC